MKFRNYRINAKIIKCKIREKFHDLLQFFEQNEMEERDVK